MRAFWWQGGLHIDPQTPEDVEALRGFAATLNVTEVVHGFPDGPIGVIKSDNEHSDVVPTDMPQDAVK